MRLLTAAVAAALLAPLTVTVLQAAPASAACASRTTKSVSVLVYGQDGRDVNASVGFDVVDAKGKAIDADPTKPSYGCAKTGGYSVPQSYLNHFVSYEGAPRGSTMKDGTKTRRDARVVNLPSNAAAVWVEVYSRGYTGSPCRDSKGNYCFNNTDVRKYGNSNLIKIPVGTQNAKAVLPMSCTYKGTAGSITGKGVNAAGKTVRLKQVYAWTEASWNAAPGLHGWGGAVPSATFTVNTLASGQTYRVWGYDQNDKVTILKGVKVNPCKATAVTIRV